MVEFKNSEGYTIRLDKSTLRLEWDCDDDPELIVDVYFYHPDGSLVNNPREFEGKWKDLTDPFLEYMEVLATEVGYPARESMLMDAWLSDDKDGRWTLYFNNRIHEFGEEEDYLF